MEVLIVIACSVICAGYYFLYYAPKKRIENFAHLAQKAGYKVKLMPFEFLGYFLVNLMEQDQKNLMVFKTEMTKYDIVVGNMMTRLAIVPSNPQILKDMFNQMSKLEKDGYYSLIFQTLNGGGIPFTQGQSWKRKRKIISSVFHFDFLNKMIPVIQAETEAQFGRINEKIKNNESVNLFFLSSRILSLVISKCFFGVDPSGYKIQDQPFCQYYIQTLDEMSNYSKTLENIVLGINAYKYRLTPKSRRLRRRVQLVHAIVKEITLKSLEIAKERRGKQTNLLTVLYDSNMLVENGQNDPNKYSVEELIGEFFAFFGAGTDTTANTLNMAMHYLSEKKFYLDKIKEELEVLDKDSVLIPADKLKNMKWIDAVFSESLRINGPVASLIPRVAVESFTAGGLDIPKGSSVSIFVLTNHYKTENFEKPLEFYPQRWMENSSPRPYSYLPFGGGERNCIGQYLARIQAKIIMSKFINTYEFKAKSPIKMQFQFVLTNASRDFELKIKNESK